VTGRWLAVLAIGVVVVSSACGAGAGATRSGPACDEHAATGSAAFATATAAPSAKPTPTLRPNEFAELEQAVRHVVPWLDDLRGVDPSDLRSGTTRSMILAQARWSLVHGRPGFLDPTFREYAARSVAFEAAYVTDKDVAAPLAAVLAMRNPVAALIGSAACVPLAAADTVVVTGTGSMTSDAFTLPDSDFVITVKGESTDPPGGHLDLHLLADDDAQDLPLVDAADPFTPGAGAYRLDTYLRFAKAGRYHLKVVAPAGSWVVSFTP
jgi:hypothetical protein